MKKKPWNVPTRAELDEIIEDDVIEKIEIKVVIELTEDMLGTIPKNKKIFTDYISEKMGHYQGHPIKEMKDLEEEIKSCPDELEKAATGFHKDTFGLLLYDYMILGCIKSNLAVLMSNGACKVYSYKKTADLYCKVCPRKIRLYRDEEKSPLMKPDGCMERPLRAETAKGPRVCLAKSDYVEAKTRMKFRIKLLRNDRGLDVETLVNALKLGKYNGMGQWRGSGGWGKFKIISLKYK